MPRVRRIRHPFTSTFVRAPLLRGRAQVMLQGGGGVDFWMDRHPSLDFTTVPADMPHYLGYIALKVGGSLLFEDAFPLVDDSDIFASMPADSVAFVTTRLTADPAIHDEDDVDNIKEMNIFEVDTYFGGVFRGWNLGNLSFVSYEDRVASISILSEEIVIATVVPAQVSVLSEEDRNTMGRRIGLGDEGAE